LEIKFITELVLANNSMLLFLSVIIYFSLRGLFTGNLGEKERFLIFPQISLSENEKTFSSCTDISITLGVHS